MNPNTRRRAVLGGAVTAVVGTTGFVLNRVRRTRDRTARWLHPAADLSPDGPFAHLLGVGDGGGVMDVEIAVFDRSEAGRDIDLFGGTERPVDGYLPPLRSFWRLDADVVGRSPGTYDLRVGDATLAVRLERDLPARYAPDRVRLTPRSTWRSDYVAYAGGHGNGDGTGTLRVVFRSPVGGATNPLDAVGLADADGRLLGERSVAAGTRETTLTVDPLPDPSEDATLVGSWNDERTEELTLFTH